MVKDLMAAKAARKEEEAKSAVLQVNAIPAQHALLLHVCLSSISFVSSVSGVSGMSGVSDGSKGSPEGGGSEECCLTGELFYTLFCPPSSALLSALFSALCFTLLCSPHYFEYQCRHICSFLSSLHLSASVLTSHHASP